MEKWLVYKSTPKFNQEALDSHTDILKRVEWLWEIESDVSSLHIKKKEDILNSLLIDWEGFSAEISISI